MVSLTARGTPTVRPRVVSASRRVLAIGLVAAVLNTLLWGLGRSLGVDFVVVPPGRTPADVLTIGAGTVAAMTVLPVLLGSGLLAATRGASERWWPRLALTGLLIGMVTVAMPLAATASTGTKVFLAAMHLVTGVTWFVQVRRASTGGRP
jgi:hypothetical protein